MLPVIRVNPKDNVAMVLSPAAAGEVAVLEGAGEVALLEDIEVNHKFALCDIAKGAPVVKYGCSIGTATENIKKGRWVHSHNLGE